VNVIVLPKEERELNIFNQSFLVAFNPPTPPPKKKKSIRQLQETAVKLSS
jgi:hypothetical protein